jgi:hypothetical protein
MKPNIETFLLGQEKYFANSYKQFLAFGGPCVYFHLECLRAGNESFLSKRHIEFLYATLTAWGLHRMGNSTTKTKLREWEFFYSSIVSQSNALQDLRHNEMLHMSMREYSEAVRGRTSRQAFKLSIRTPASLARSRRRRSSAAGALLKLEQSTVTVCGSSRWPSKSARAAVRSMPFVSIMRTDKSEAWRSSACCYCYHIVTK